LATLTQPSKAIEIRGQSFTVRHARPEDLAEARAHILRVTEEDLKFPYTPRFHFDIDQAEIVYLQDPRQALFVAIDDVSGRIIGTTSVRTGGPVSPPHPAWFTRRYDWNATAQLYRVYVAREHRRRGVASALVEAARRFVVADGAYCDIYLHTDAGVEAAEPFWRSVARITYDSRVDGNPANTVHFELPLHQPLPSYRSGTGESKVDWHDWYWRWERQQSSYIAFREERFDVMLNALAALMPEKFTLVDLMCGPGSITRRVVERFPGARVVAIDLDPVLVAMGKAVIGDADGRVRWEEANLADADWARHLHLGIEQVDAVLSTTAIHWLPAGGIVDLYRQLARVIRAGGVLMNGDQMDFVEASPVLRGLGQERREAHRAHASKAGAESWEHWWLSLREEPSLKDLFAERDRRFAWRGAERERAIGADRDDRVEPVQHTHFEVHRAGLLDAGFREVDVIWQHLANRVLAAVR
jgi:GNAT superfamily N-acetyltransferase/ubiquinone/menaquinone biosynthesis C-methylase UbiE